MTSVHALTLADLLIDSSILVVLVVSLASRRVPQRWRGTAVVLAVVVLFNLAQSSLALEEVPNPIFSAGRLLHAGEIAALALTVFVFSREMRHPDRLLERAEARRTAGVPGLDAVPAIVLTMTRDGVVRHINRHCAESLGSSAKSLIGREVFRLTPRGEERKRVKAEFMLFVGSAGTLGGEAEYTIQTADGPRLIRWRRTAQLDKGGNVMGVVSYGEDITERRDTEERLAAESYLLDSVHDAVLVLGPHGETLYFNRAAHDRIGLTADEFEGLRTADWLEPESRVVVARHIEEVRRIGAAMVEVVAQTKDGINLPLELRSQKITFEHKDCVMIVLRDISSRRQAQSLIEQMAFTDPLTGLSNRRTVLDSLAVSIYHLTRHDAPPVVFYLDVDNLKSVNDTLGHEAGDRLIRLVSERITEVLRDNDTIGRVGGDEFVIVLPHPGDADAVEEVAHRLLDRLAEPLTLDGHELRVGASIGIALCAPGLSAAEVITRADRAMYEAKRSGGRRFLWHSVSMDEEFRDRFMLKNDLAQALEREEFVLDFQPIVGGLTRRTIAAEALLRWRHPTRGLLGPDMFIDLAEQTGAIRDIGRWVLWTACSTLADWRQRGLDLQRIAVNVSPLQLSEPSFVSDVLATVNAFGLDPGSLELELTETQAMENSLEVGSIFARLRAEGIRLALDDFGVGHSSLERLRRLPITTLKMDRTFVADLCYSSHAHPIVETVLVLAANLKLNVVAEGVETSCQADYLRDAGCSELQGYAFARPMPAEALYECAREPLAAAHCENVPCLKEQEAG